MTESVRITTRVADNRLSLTLVVCGVIAACTVKFLPGYATNAELLGFLVFLEFVLLAVWKFRQWYFPFLLLIFFFAGTGVPPVGFWQAARWMVLAVGAAAGVFVFPRYRRVRVRKFHLLALLCLITAALSAFASSYPRDSLLKATSFFLLFLYSAFGMRAAVAGREREFIAALVRFCEVLTYVTTMSYLALHYEFFGNPNSLGAVMGVLVIPLLLWVVFSSKGTADSRRYILPLGLAIFLLAISYARAGILAAVVSCVLLCVVFRRYRALIVLVAVGLFAGTIVSFTFPLTPDAHKSLATAFIYKGHPEEGVLGSRTSPWDQTIASVRDHPWFGTGFGTSANGANFDYDFNNFRAATRDTREHGNSYLAILEWVGLIGVCPFVVFLSVLVLAAARLLTRAHRDRNYWSPAVPIAAVLFAGLIHAVFEDWLFAAGYYLCFLFWGLAFVLADFSNCGELVSH